MSGGVTTAVARAHHREISQGPNPQPLVVIPRIVGQKAADANALLRSLGVRVFLLTRATRYAAKHGLVVEQQPAVLCGVDTPDIPRGAFVVIFIGRYAGWFEVLPDDVQVRGRRP